MSGSLKNNVRYVGGTGTGIENTGLMEKTSDSGTGSASLMEKTSDSGTRNAVLVEKTSGTGTNVKMGNDYSDNHAPNYAYDYVPNYTGNYASNYAADRNSNNVVDGKNAPARINRSFTNKNSSVGKSVENLSYNVNSEAWEALKKFYLYAATSGNYKKAYYMLDEKFTVRIDILRKYNLYYFDKKDLKPQTYSLFDEYFKKAEIYPVAEEKNSKGISIIYFYQTVPAKKTEDKIIPLVVKMKEAGGMWKILSAFQSTGTVKPFNR